MAQTNLVVLISTLAESYMDVGQVLCAKCPRLDRQSPNCCDRWRINNFGFPCTLWLQRQYSRKYAHSFNALVFLHRVESVWYVIYHSAMNSLLRWMIMFTVKLTKSSIRFVNKLPTFKVNLNNLVTLFKRESINAWLQHYTEHKCYKQRQNDSLVWQLFLSEVLFNLKQHLWP